MKVLQPVEPVVPLAKLRVRPADFPFLDHVAGHSDPELARLSAATDTVLAAVTGPIKLLKVSTPGEVPVSATGVTAKAMYLVLSCLSSKCGVRLN